MTIPEENILRDESYDNKSFYVVTAKGSLRQMPIPMRARSKIDLDDIPVKTWIRIEEFLMTKDGHIAYLINGKIYLHTFFEIILRPYP